MKSSIEKLQKFFKLEADRSYDNKAVMGGLARMLDSWVADARADSIPEELIQTVSGRLKDYDRLSPNSRKDALYGLWNRVKRELGAADIPETEKTKGAPTSPQKESPPPPVPAKTSPVETVETAQQPPAETQPSETASPPEPRPEPKQEGPSAALNANVTVLPRVGPRYANTLERLGIRTLGDMIYHFPRRYDDYSELKPINRLRYDEEVTVIGTIQSIHTRNIRSGKSKMSEAVVSDGSAALRISWFNQPWISQRLKKGMQIVLSGKVDQYLGRLTINNPEWEPMEQKHLHTNRIVPVYPLTARITQRWLRNLMHKVVMYWAPRVVDPFPKTILEGAEIVNLATALEQVHFPDSIDLLKAARHRLAFDEIFLLQLGVLQQKQTWQTRTAQPFTVSDEWLAEQLGKLPFKLTDAQQKTLSDVHSDLASGHPMNRLVQGDVGSGKTIIAAMATAVIGTAGAQTAIMAPTSILAEQHYQNFISVLAGEDGLLPANQIRLMVGATADAEKREIREGLTTGEIKVIIGTHALIEDPIEFENLQLAVIDEQHRFGVKQRAALRSKGTNPHLLVMTATPIPRSLALTVYGDLDLSVIDEMPPGRQLVDTHILYPKERERAYRLVHKELAAGHQAFIIYPLVEESEKSEDKAAVEEHERLQQEIFPNHKLGLLHGRLKSGEKEEIMARFRDGDYHVLVSTSVVEVGVDVPNATVMLIEGAHRFGLAQLHQFRGRVGRGQEKAFCLLIPQSAESVENERLQAMAESNDGFVLAEKDLEQRGAGDFLGTRQSGFSELKLASLTNVKLIEKARRQAQAVFEHDPELTAPENQGLVEFMDRFWDDGQGDIS
jgi:ATP-dependent DNA helicase RecG